MGRGGARGCRGGGGFGSSSHPSFHTNSSSDNLVRDGAASKGLSSLVYGWWSDSLMENDKLQHCKDLVHIFERCGIIERKGKGKGDRVCQSFLRELEESCAEYKSSWSDWWSKDMKKEYCRHTLYNFKQCVNVDACTIYREELQDICGMVVD